VSEIEVRRRPSESILNLIAVSCAWAHMLSQRLSTAVTLYSAFIGVKMHRSEFEEALHWYDKCLSIAPELAEAHTAKAFALHMHGSYDEAIATYHKVSHHDILHMVTVSILADKSFATCATD
jgi:tetratricopeptide (TPR) repeat protein